MTEPMPAEIDWCPDGVVVVYATDPEWWATDRRVIREARARDVVQK